VEQHKEFKLTSIFSNIFIENPTWNSLTINEIKNIILNKLEEHNINLEDSNVIKLNLKKIDDLHELNKYVTNSLLFFEGYSEKDYKPGKKDELFTKKGTIRKRRPKQKNVYFTQDTEDAIVAYVGSTNNIERNKIYNEKINYAFYKLAENIIHTFKFYYTDMDNIEELKHEVVTFLLEKLHLYHHSKNINDKLKRIIKIENNEEYIQDSFILFTNNSSVVVQDQINQFISTLNVSDKCMQDLLLITPPKAYSYFGTIVKRYLIKYNIDNYKALREKGELSEVDDDETITNNLIIQCETEGILENFMDYYIQYIDKRLFTLFPKIKDQKIADALLFIFKKRENLEIFNKKVIYIYVKEMVEADTFQITRVIKVFKDLYYKLYNKYYDNNVGF
jgi:hypothetical protein